MKVLTNQYNRSHTKTCHHLYLLRLYQIKEVKVDLNGRYLIKLLANYCEICILLEEYCFFIFRKERERERQNKSVSANFGSDIFMCVLYFSLAFKSNDAISFSY